MFDRANRTTLVMKEDDNDINGKKATTVKYSYMYDFIPKVCGGMTVVVDIKYSSREKVWFLFCCERLPGIRKRTLVTTLWSYA